MSLQYFLKQVGKCLSCHFVGRIYRRQERFTWERLYFLMSNHYFCRSCHQESNFRCHHQRPGMCNFDWIYIPLIVEIS